MGALAETIKTAEAAENDEFTVSLERLMDEAKAPVGEPARSALAAAQIPSSAQESKRRLLKWVTGIGGGAVAVGALLRLLRAGSESARRKELYEDVISSKSTPTEVSVPMPQSKRAGLAKESALWPWVLGTAAVGPSALKAVGTSAEDAWEGGKETVSKGVEHLFQPTGSAISNPWTLPIGFVSTIAALYGGYKVTDTIINKMRARRRQRELAGAERDFERSLRAQFHDKSASLLARAVDGVAQAYVSGELQKQAASLETESMWDQARGAGNAAAGGYLALLTLLASLGAAGGYHYVKSRETPRRKYEIAKELLLRRRMAQPPVVTADVD